jgi:hypothetical protein
MTFRVLLLLILAQFLSSEVSSQAISLDSVDGLHATDSIIADGNTSIVFYLRLTNCTFATDAISNGFRIFSDDGAEWNNTIGDTLSGLGIKDMFDQLFVINPWSITGSGADTIGFAGSRIFSTGLPADFDDVMLKISIGPITPGVGNHGKTITLDSSFFQPSGTWKWTGCATLIQWDGPHTFTIVDPFVDVQSIEDGSLPNHFSLDQNYPNPFNPHTNIEFYLPRQSYVKLSIYNILGQEIKILIDKPMNGGRFVADWDSTDKTGNKVTSGIYLYSLQIDEFQISKKMILLK